MLQIHLYTILDRAQLTTVIKAYYSNLIQYLLIFSIYLTMRRFLKVKEWIDNKKIGNSFLTMLIDGIMLSSLNSKSNSIEYNNNNENHQQPIPHILYNNTSAKTLNHSSSR